MSGSEVVGLVAIAGCLTLVLAEMRTHRLGFGKALSMMLVWVFIFALAWLVFARMGG